METLPSFCRKFLIRNMPKACFAFLQKVFRGAVGTKRLRNVIRRFSFLSSILAAKRPAVILLRKNRWNLRPAKESESFIRVRGRQVRLWRPVQVRSLRSVRITAILLRKSRANLLQSCSLAGGSRSWKPPAALPQATSRSNRNPLAGIGIRLLCQNRQGILSIPD